jgi:hypothetical protein
MQISVRFAPFKKIRTARRAEVPVVLPRRIFIRRDRLSDLHALLPLLGEAILVRDVPADTSRTPELLLHSNSQPERSKRTKGHFSK